MYTAPPFVPYFDSGQAVTDSGNQARVRIQAIRKDQIVRITGFSVTAPTSASTGTVRIFNGNILDSNQFGGGFITSNPNFRWVFSAQAEYFYQGPNGLSILFSGLNTGDPASATVYGHWIKQ